MKWRVHVGDKPKYVSFHWNTRIIEFTNYGAEVVYVGTTRQVGKADGIPLMPIPEGSNFGGSLTLTRVGNAPVRGLYLVCPKGGTECEVEVIWTEA